jgi:hypothetical protein
MTHGPQSHGGTQAQGLQAEEGVNMDRRHHALRRPKVATPKKG